MKGNESIEDVYRRMLETKETFARKSQLVGEMQEELMRMDTYISKHEQQMVGYKKREEERSIRRQEVEVSTKNKTRVNEIRSDLDKRLSLKYNQKTVIMKELNDLKDKQSNIESELKRVKDDISKMKSELQERNQRRFDVQISVDNIEKKVVCLNVNESDEEELIWNLEKKSDKELIMKLKKMMIARLRYTEKDKANFEKLEEYFRTHGEYRTELKELNSGRKTFDSIMGNIV